ncbi:MAG: CpsD/CapB family tyrosine-protein kinase [Alphaproteobacteria bacterium]
MSFRAQFPPGKGQSSIRRARFQDIRLDPPEVQSAEPAGSARPLFEGALAYAEPQLLQKSVERDIRHRQSTPIKRVLSQPQHDLLIRAGAANPVQFAYNRVRTQILRRLQEKAWSTIAVTSPCRGTGTTLTAINTAISIAREFNHAALLVELDLLKPSFQRIFGLDHRDGIVDHLLRGVPIEQILLDSGIDGLSIIPAGSPVSNSSELLSSPEMARFIDVLKHYDRNRIILFDLPPVLATDDAVAFSQFADCVLLIIEEGMTRIREIRQVLNDLGPANLLGVVLNRSSHCKPVK